MTSTISFNFYEAFRTLHSAFQDEDRLRTYLEDARAQVGKLRDWYASLTSENAVHIDYSLKETKRAYFLAYYPNHILPLSLALSQMASLGYGLNVQDPEFVASFIGGGPAPEALGLTHYFAGHISRVKSVIGHVLDPYADDWGAFQQNTIKLSKIVWPEGSLNIATHTTFDLTDPDFKWLGLPEKTRSALKNSKLVVMQNCLTDQIHSPKTFVQNFTTLFANLEEDTALVLLDFVYPQVHEVLISIRDSVMERGLGRVLLELDRDVSPQPDIPLSFRQALFPEQNKHHARGDTKFYRIVLIRQDQTVNHVTLGWAGTNVARETELKSDIRLGSTTQLMETLLAPGGKLRSSPHLLSSLHRTMLGTALAKRDSIQQVLDVLQSEVTNAQLDRWAEEWVASDSNEETPSGILARFQHRIAQLQRTLLDTLRSGRDIARMRYVLASKSPYIDALAVADFQLALLDVYTFLDDAERQILLPQITVVGAEPPGYLKQLVASFEEIVKDVYGLDLSFENLVPTRDSMESLMSGEVTVVADLQSNGHLSFDIDTLGANPYTLLVVAKDGAALAQWRKAFVDANPGVDYTGPCGDEFGGTLPDSCATCRIVRPLRVHLSPVTNEFWRRVQALTDDASRRPPRVFSAVTVRYTGYPRHASLPILDPSQPLIVDDVLPVRYIGTIGRAIFGNVKERFDLPICPGLTSAPSAELHVPPGRSLPSIQHGDLLLISGARVQRLGYDGKVRIELTSESNVSVGGFSPQTIVGFLSHYTSRTRAAIDKLAWRWFGFKSMRDFQHEILEQVLCGRPILGIAATGGGKSECFILPALTLPGITIVISPLKSLMQDQFEQRLRDRYGVDDLATFINGDVPLAERERRMRELERGTYKLVYMTPEQLERNYILESLRRADQQVGIRYLALDEAHCISQWGHDFRPSYLNMLTRLYAYDIRPVPIALTATASPNVRADICKELGLLNVPLSEGGNVHLVSSNRPELNLRVKVVDSTAEKADIIISELDRLVKLNRTTNFERGAAIVFMPHTGRKDSRHQISPTELANKEVVSDRRDLAPNNGMDNNDGKASAGVEPFASYIERRIQQRISIYHGKMPGETDDSNLTEDEDILLSFDSNQLTNSLGDVSGRQRQSEQQAFIQGETEIMVATKGFGMGIDKPNVRLIVHRTAPGNLEAYVQEAGRAGRDGKFADALLLYSSPEPDQRIQSDREIQGYFLENRYIRDIDVRVMRDFLRSRQPYLENTYSFSSDEAIYYFNNHEQFEWPEWPEIQELEMQLSQRNLDEFKTVKLRGKVYALSREYIGRILNVLYRIRPDLELRTSVPFLCGSQDIRTRLKVRKLDAKTIWHSDYYFGDVIRNVFASSSKLADVFPTRVILGMEILAPHFGMTITELSQLLTDIQKVQGTYAASKYGRKRWVGDLIDFTTHIRPTPPLFSEEHRAWLNWAGASKSVLKKAAQASASRAARVKLSLEDWFPPDKIESPKAWDVTVGEGFTNDSQFEVYLRAFMQIHNDRERNDRAAYERLVSDYVGIGTDQYGRETHNPQNCLRQVMLGYLKTGEIVVGGNCRSCSVCVPDGDFNRFGLEERAAVTAHLGHAFENMLIRIEAMTAEIPPVDLVTQLFASIQADRNEDRGTDVYVQSWCAKLLQETPSHLAALWIRMKGAVELGFGLTPTEVVLNLQTLYQSVPVSNAPVLLELATAACELEGVDTSRIELICARLCERMGEREATFDFLSRIDSYNDKTLLPEACSWGFEITNEKGTFPDASRHQYYGLRAGAFAKTWTSCTTFFTPFAVHSTLDEVAEAAKSLSKSRRAALHFIWLTGQEEVSTALTQLMDQYEEFWRDVPVSSLSNVIDAIGLGILTSSSAQLASILRSVEAAHGREVTANLVQVWLDYLRGTLPGVLQATSIVQVGSDFNLLWGHCDSDTLKLVLVNHSLLLDREKSSLGVVRVLADRVLELRDHELNSLFESCNLAQYDRVPDMLQFASAVHSHIAEVPQIASLLRSSSIGNALKLRNWQDASASTLTRVANVLADIGLMLLSNELRVCSYVRDTRQDPHVLLDTIWQIAQLPSNERVFEPEYKDNAILFAQFAHLITINSLDELVNWHSIFSLDLMFMDQATTDSIVAVVQSILEHPGPKSSHQLEPFIAVLRSQDFWWTKLDELWEGVSPTTSTIRLIQLGHAYQHGWLGAVTYEQRAIKCIDTLRTIEHDDVQILEQLARNNELDQLSSLGRMIGFIREFQTAEPGFSAAVNGRTFGRIANWVEQKEGTEYALFASELMMYLRLHAGFPRSFLTPVGYIIQMLCKAGRYDAADHLVAESYDEIRVKGMPAERYIMIARHTSSHSMRTDLPSPIYQKLLKSLVPNVQQEPRF